MSTTARKRKLSEVTGTTTNDIVGRPSPYHPAVTLLELKTEDVEDSKLFQTVSESQATPRAKRTRSTTAVTPRTSTPRTAKLAKLEPLSPDLKQPSTSSSRLVNQVAENVLQTKHAIQKEEPLSDLSDLEDMKLVVAPLDPVAPSPLKTKSRVSLTAGSRKKVKPVPMGLDVPHATPEEWRVVYDTIHEMREGIVAPVDTTGHHMAGQAEADPRNKRYVTLVALMLSSQTKDEVTHAAVINLRNALGTLTIENIIAADDSVVSGAINKVGFWRRKTEYLKKAAEKLRDDFGSDVPKTVDELCSLPGVGPKMAFLCLQTAWNINMGIGVDVHVHRITNRLGWHQPATKTPEQTRLNLQSWLPKELHPGINNMLVGFGQVICLPVNPKCDSCKLDGLNLCPSARKGTAKGKPKLEVELEE